MSKGPLNIWPDTMRPGDLILTHGDGWLSRSIRWFGQRATGNCRVNHTAIFAGRMPDGKVCVIEEVGKLRIAPLAVYADTPCVVYQMRELTNEQREAIMAALLPVVGQGYGWGKIPLFALDSIFRTYWFTRTLGITSFKVCSQAAAWAYGKSLGRDAFGKHWKCVSPDWQDDFCAASADWSKLHDTIKSG